MNNHQHINNMDNNQDIFTNNDTNNDTNNGLIYIDLPIYFSYNPINTIPLTYFTNNIPIIGYNNEPSLDDILRQSFNESNNKYINVVSEKGLELLEYITYNIDISDSFEYDSCPITTEKFDEGETIVKLPCSHVFSKEPILEWLQKSSNKCPLCRYELPSIEIKNVDDNTNDDVMNNEQHYDDDHDDEDNDDDDDEDEDEDEGDEDEDEDADDEDADDEDEDNHQVNNTNNNSERIILNIMNNIIPSLNRNHNSYYSEFINNNIISNEELVLQQALFESLNN
jgi:hypothetical protein